MFYSNFQIPKTIQFLQNIIFRSLKGKCKIIIFEFESYITQFLRKLEGNRIILTVPASRGLNSIRQDIAFT